jgi:adenylate kinase
MRLVLIGPPGAGKGTQAERICRERGLEHLSTGDLLRAAVTAGTPLGKEAKGYMDRGELVPDRLVLRLVRERLGGDDGPAGFLLDGFPRNESQATALEKELGRDALDLALLITVDEEELVRRLLGRGRKDDNEVVIRNRLRVYADETAPLVARYRGRAMLREVDGNGSVEEVARRIRRALGPHKAEAGA